MPRISAAVRPCIHNIFRFAHEDEAFWFDECRILPELGKLLRSVPENNFQRAEQLIVAYRYLAYDFDQPFLPQYRDNMLFLKAMLEKLA